MVEAATHTRNLKKRDLSRLTMSIVIIVLCNFVGTFLFHRFDLTSEKRYTLSPESKEIAKNLKVTAFFKIYLDGKLPPGLIKLRDETKEMLDEFRAYSNGKIQYEFINPSASSDEQQQKAVFHQLYEAGLTPTELEVKDNSGNSQQIIWPGAILSYMGRDIPIQLLQTQMDADPQTQLNNSIEALEYDIDNAIHKLSIQMRPRVAFIDGQGELDSLSTADALKGLSEYYDVHRITLHQRLKSLQTYKAIIIAKPDTAFDEKDKFIIDQFIMRGGKVLWLLDALSAPMDSLKRNGMTLAFPANLNLEDQLFKYGVRVNTNLIMDMQCADIQLNMAYPGQQPQFKPFPWFFEPLISSTSDNPIVKNLNLIELNLANTIDTIAVRGIKKTILLTTSKYTRLMNSPARVSLAMAQMKPDERQFTRSFEPVAVLLEGKFTSLYKDRIDMPKDSINAMGFTAESIPTSMIVVSDGDVIANAVRHSDNFTYPLGYDIYMKTQFGNRDFIINCMNYLCGDENLLTIRTKQLTLRLLDGKKAVTFRTRLQIINMVIPITLIILLGIIMTWIRKQKYAK
jgi:gliding motility-associatede transport system auxiliary component